VYLPLVVAMAAITQFSQKVDSYGFANDGSIYCINGGNKYYENVACSIE
jgi:hypothetical protein